MLFPTLLHYSDQLQARVSPYREHISEHAGCLCARLTVAALKIKAENTRQKLSTSVFKVCTSWAKQHAKISEHEIRESKTKQLQGQPKI